MNFTDEMASVDVDNVDLWDYSAVHYLQTDGEVRCMGTENAKHSD